MKARVMVSLKPGVLDPQGKAIEGALRSLGVEGIRSVRQGKVFEIEVDGDPDQAERTLQAASEKLLANTVIENFQVIVKRPQPPAATPAPAAPAKVDPQAATETAAADAQMPSGGHP